MLQKGQSLGKGPHWLIFLNQLGLLCFVGDTDRSLSDSAILFVPDSFAFAFDVICLDKAHKYISLKRWNCIRRAFLLRSVTMFFVINNHEGLWFECNYMNSAKTVFSGSEHPVALIFLPRRKKVRISYQRRKSKDNCGWPLKI